MSLMQSYFVQRIVPNNSACSKILGMKVFIKLDIIENNKELDDIMWEEPFIAVQLTVTASSWSFHGINWTNTWYNLWIAYSIIG